LVERGFIEVIVTTFSPRRYDPHWPRGDREALARGGVALLAGTHRIPGFVSLGTSTPMCPRGTRSPPVVVHPRIGDLSPVQANTKGQTGPAFSQAEKGGSTGPRDRSRRVNCGNDEDDQPEWSRRPGPRVLHPVNARRFRAGQRLGGER
jgi:hypothetical protein